MDWVGSAIDEQEAMLATIGVASVDELLLSVPRRLEGLLHIPAGLSEPELVRHLTDIAAKNRPAGYGRSFIGAGACEHAIPAAIDALISRGEFFTAYTPYQPEASQGTLTATFEFQTMVAEIMGMDVANASMYDGPTAMAEAALLAQRHTKRSRVVVSKTVHPEWREVLHTYQEGLDAPLAELDHQDGRTGLDACRNAVTGDTACLIVQQPNFYGQLEDLQALGEIAHQAGALFIVAANPLSLGVLAPPGEVGADIAVGDAQPLGIPLNYGGPYAGLFAVQENLIRQLPGRLAGMAWDADGRRGFTLTLQTREQHIRRERATSNICTNQALLALSATIYLALVGRAGFQDIARQNLLKAHWAAEELCRLPGVSLAFDGPFFNEFVLRLPKSAADIARNLTEHGMWGGLDLGRFSAELADCIMVCVTETKTRKDIEDLVQAYAEALR